MSRAKRELDYDNQEFATRKDRIILKLDAEVKVLKAQVEDLKNQLRDARHSLIK